MDIPIPVGELCLVSPVSVKASENYETFRLSLGEFASSISQSRADSDSAYTNLSTKLAELKNLKKELAGHLEDGEKELVSAQNQLHSMFSRLDTPINEAIAYLSVETRRYHEEKERLQREFDETIRQKTAIEQEKLKRKDDLMALRRQVSGARAIADHSDMSGMTETAKEIRLGIQKYANLDVNPDSYPKPLKDIEEIRAIIAKAFQNEQERTKS